MESKVKILQPYSSIKELVSNIYFNILKIRIACSAYGGEVRGIQGFGREPEGKTPLGRPRRRREDNIKMDIQEGGLGVWTGSSWLRRGTGGRHL
jgi:hypothetical protein